MGRIIALLLGLVAIAFAVKMSLTGTSGPGSVVPPEVESGVKAVQANGEHTRPRQQLDNVRDRTHELEKEMQKKVDEAGRKAAEGN
jgi:hypothetical protein